jgi:uncharacterized membrane protein
MNYMDWLPTLSHLGTLEDEMTELLKMAVIAFEAVAVMVLIFGATFSIGRFIKRLLQGWERHEEYRVFRQDFGRILMLALDLLVAADIILTVALDLTFESLGILGLLVLIRTFLHFVLELEVTGRWPWQASQGAAGESSQ